MKLDVVNLENQKVGEVDVLDEIFAVPLKAHLLHDVVRMQLASRRRGTHQTKTRSETHGTTKKMYKQKGTGRARHGNALAPHFSGGGVAFGPHPRSYAYRLPRKVRRGALRCVLSEKLRQGQLKVVDEFGLDVPKTKAATRALAALEVSRGLVVDAQSNRNLLLSLRNLKEHKFLASAGLNVYDALRFESLVLTRSALNHIQETLRP